MRPAGFCLIDHDRLGTLVSPAIPIDQSVQIFADLPIIKDERGRLHSAAGSLEVGMRGVSY